MVLTVRCLICKKELKYSYGDASELVLHIKSEHPLINLKRSSESKKQFEEVLRTPTKEALESFIRNSKVLYNLVDQDSQTVNVDNIPESMDETLQDIPVAKSKRDSKDSRKSSSSPPRTSNRGSKGASSARDSSILKEPPKRTSKDESSLEESFNVPEGLIFESTRNSMNARTPPDSPKRKSLNSRSPPDSPRRKSLDLVTPPDSPKRISKEVRKTVELSSKRNRDIRIPVTTSREKSMENRNEKSNSIEATPLTNGKKTRYNTGNSEILETETTIDESNIKKNKLYRTSLQKWRPGGEKLTCPNCGETKKPIIRAHTERVAHSSFGASLIATCWPFCLAPCLFPEPFLEFIHCSVCDHYLGKYDHKQKLLSPNKNNK